MEEHAATVFGLEDMSLTDLCDTFTVNISYKSIAKFGNFLKENQNILAVS